MRSGQCRRATPAPLRRITSRINGSAACPCTENHAAILESQRLQHSVHQDCSAMGKTWRRRLPPRRAGRRESDRRCPLRSSPCAPFRRSHEHNARVRLTSRSRSLSRLGLVAVADARSLSPRNPRCRDKARELEVFVTRQLGCSYWALEYQGHGASSPNFLECTLSTWCGTRVGAGGGAGLGCRAVISATGGRRSSSQHWWH